MNRRQLLQSVSAAPALFTLPVAKEAAKIAIRDLEVFRVKVNRRGDWLLMRTATLRTAATMKKPRACSNSSSRNCAGGAKVVNDGTRPDRKM